MSYQYPPPPSSAETGMPHTGYMASFDSLPPSSETGLQSEYGPNYSPGDRRGSLSNAMQLKRSMSTSDVRPQLPLQQSPAQQQGQPMDHVAFLAGEKRRNKLGYHRTSVACGHCRRRKIRCIPSPDDPQGRCINCIRLKKDCTFFPVDQPPPPPPTDTRHKSTSRSSVGPGKTMAPPSVKSVGRDGFSPEARLPKSASGTRASEYGHAGMTNWMAADASPSTRSHHHESSVAPAFSPYTTHTPVSAVWTTPGSADASSRDRLPWSSCQASSGRSMSFDAESTSGHHQYPPISHITTSGRPYDRRSASIGGDIYSTPIVSSAGALSITGAALEQNESLSTAAVPASSYGSWHQPYSQGWYGEDGSSYASGTDENVGYSSTSQPHGTGLYYGSR